MIAFKILYKRRSSALWQTLSLRRRLCILTEIRIRTIQPGRSTWSPSSLRTLSSMSWAMLLHKFASWWYCAVPRKTFLSAPNGSKGVPDYRSNPILQPWGSLQTVVGFIMWTIHVYGSISIRSMKMGGHLIWISNNGRTISDFSAQSQTTKQIQYQIQK